MCQVTGSCSIVEIKHYSTSATLCAMLINAISVVTEFIVRKIEFNRCELSSGVVLSYGTIEVYIRTFTNGHLSDSYIHSLTASYIR